MEWVATGLSVVLAVWAFSRVVRRARREELERERLARSFTRATKEREP